MADLYIQELMNVPQRTPQILALEVMSKFRDESALTDAVSRNGKK